MIAQEHKSDKWGVRAWQTLLKASGRPQYLRETETFWIHSWAVFKYIVFKYIYCIYTLYLNTFFNLYLITVFKYMYLNTFLNTFLHTPLNINNRSSVDWSANHGFKHFNAVTCCICLLLNITVL